jgi:hypothetical protein
MSKMLPVVAIVAALAIPQLLVAPSISPALTEQQVAAAIALGQKTKTDDIGVAIKLGRMRRFNFNPAKTLYQGMAGGVGVQEVWNAFEGRLLTPIATIALAAAEHKGTGARFIPTPELRQPALRLMLKNIEVAPYIKTVVIRKDESDSNGVTGECVSAFSGVPAQGMCSGYKFPLEHALHLLNDQFVVTVQVTTNQGADIKHFKVERKDLNKLPL